MFVATSAKYCMHLVLVLVLPSSISNACAFGAINVTTACLQLCCSCDASFILCVVTNRSISKHP